MTLLELAECCERATGPSFVLEQQIAEAVGRGMTLPPFTSSLDSALTLAPGIRHVEWIERGAEACCFGECEFDSAVYMGKAATAPLAICAAGLRALAAGSRRAETNEDSAQCEASQSGGEAVTPKQDRL